MLNLLVLESLFNGLVVRFKPKRGHKSPDPAVEGFCTDPDTDPVCSKNLGFHGLDLVQIRANFDHFSL